MLHTTKQSCKDGRSWKMEHTLELCHIANKTFPHVINVGCNLAIIIRHMHCKTLISNNPWFYEQTSKSSKLFWKFRCFRQSHVENNKTWCRREPSLAPWFYFLIGNQNVNQKDMCEIQISERNQFAQSLFYLQKHCESKLGKIIQFKRVQLLWWNITHKEVCS